MRAEVNCRNFWEESGSIFKDSYIKLLCILHPYKTMNVHIFLKIWNEIDFLIIALPIYVILRSRDFLSQHFTIIYIIFFPKTKKVV